MLINTFPQMFLLLDTMPMGVLVLASDLTVLFWNSRLTEWTGVQREQIVGKLLTDLYPELGSIRYAGRILPVFDGGPPVIFSPQLHPHLIPSVRADGQKRILQTTVTPITINNAACALASIQDVTDLMLTARESRRLHQQATKELEQRKSIESALQESSEKLRSIFDTAVEAILVINTDQLIEEFNPAAERIFGYPAGEVIGRNIKMLMPEPYTSEHDSYVKHFLQTGQARIIGTDIGREMTGLRKDGTTFPMRLGVSEMHVGNKVLFTGILNDITDQKRLEEQLRNMAMKDGLTGISNRRSFDEALDREWRRMLREYGKLSVILIDIDFFKNYNDTYGHHEGDTCLKAVAAAIDRSVHRAGDLAARYGGEEFVVLLPATDINAATDLAERIRLSVEELSIPHTASGAAPHITISLGVASIVPDQGGMPEMLLNFADQGLYAAKASGRNRVKIAKEALAV
ncbi:MAG: sensor domain-containing diguanylate cyclase [Desulfuromonadaceae bacterium]